LFLFQNLHSYVLRRLYDSCLWEEKAIRRLIGDGKLAARLKGNENRLTEDEQECPICFLHYPEINTTKCCKANVCTECYLQVRPQKEKSSSCPFCNHAKLQITVAKKVTEHQIQQRQQEEKLIEEHRQRERGKSVDGDIAGGDGGLADTSGSSSSAEQQSEFGSSLAQDERVAIMRARSESFASSEGNGSSTNNNMDDTNVIQSIALTADERRRLEEEMRAQVNHPLALQMQQEAAERSLQNERAYYRSNSGHFMARDRRVQRTAEALRSARNSSRRNRGRDWNQIVDSFERNGHGQVHSIDDLVVLEAAILLSMEEEAARNGNREASFDPSEHAGQGFPLVRSFLASRGLEGSSSLRNTLLADSSSSSSSRRSRRSAQGRMRSTGNIGMDTAAMMMHGMSEEDQIALAIAASLQEQNASTQSSENDNGGNEDDNNNNENISSEAGTPQEVAPEMAPENEDGNEQAAGSIGNVCASEELELEAVERAAVGIVLDDSISQIPPENTEDTSTSTSNVISQDLSMTGVGIGIAVADDEDENQTAEVDTAPTETTTLTPDLTQIPEDNGESPTTENEGSSNEAILAPDVSQIPDETNEPTESAPQIGISLPSDFEESIAIEDGTKPNETPTIIPDVSQIPAEGSESADSGVPTTTDTQPADNAASEVINSEGEDPSELVHEPERV
jgi:hypothetical protein